MDTMRYARSRLQHSSPIKRVTLTLEETSPMIWRSELRALWNYC